MVVEGVLRPPESEGVIATGRGLYESLAPATRLYLLTHTWAEKPLAQWLFDNQLSGHLGILTATGPTPPERIDALRRVRSWRIELVIEPDPYCAIREIADGWNALVYAPATFTDPRWRPDREQLRPWHALTDEIRRQHELRRAQPPVPADEETP